MVASRFRVVDLSRAWSSREKRRGTLGKLAKRITTPTLIPLGLANDNAPDHPSYMPQSLSAVYIHLVFCTKDRRPRISKNLRPIFSRSGSDLRTQECTVEFCPQNTLN